MEKISFDSGVKTYKINGMGVLRFNPSDPNLFVRFLEAGEKMQAVEKMLEEQAKMMAEADGTAVVQLMHKADKEMKQLLCWVFGQENDFDSILGGMNLLAVAENGQRVITNFLSALQPILVAGAERCAQEKTQEALQKAKTRRERKQ